MMSIIIPSVKEKIATLACIPFHPQDVIVSRVKGVSYARNEGAKYASHDLLVFLDDDISLNFNQWLDILTMQKGTFLMAFSKSSPSTRVLALWKTDFERVGGFDSRFNYAAEDKDFYYRALEAGLVCKPLNYYAIKHFTHPYRLRSLEKGFHGSKEHAYVLARHGRRNKWMTAKHLLDRILRFKVRTLLYELAWLCIFKIGGADRWF